MGDSQHETPYLDAVVDYASRRPGRFHIPGHKGGDAADEGLVEAFGAAALDRDVPSLIFGIDVGPGPTPFERAQRLAAEAWGASRSWFLINGASQGNHAACLAIRQSGRRVIVQRNVHSSTVDGLILAGLEPVFAAPELDPDLGLAHCLTPDALSAALGSAPDAVAAFVVSPTYFGAAADIAALAEVAHARGVPLVCDESWGAHLHFCAELPQSALAGGADLVLNSVHKIVGSLGQSAILHLGHGERIDEHAVDRAVTLTESTSPSALLTGSLDAARRHAAVHGDELLRRTLAELRRARELIREIPGLDVLDERLAGRRSIHGWDPLRLAVDVRATGASGQRIATMMRELDDINLELAAETVIVAVFGLGEDVASSSRLLVDSLRRAVDALGVTEPVPARPFAEPPPWGPLEVAPREAFLRPQHAVAFEAAEGRIAAESLAAYPPGVPNVLPGERLTSQTIDYIRETLAAGGQVRGPVDRSVRTLRVLGDG